MNIPGIKFFRGIDAIGNKQWNSYVMINNEMYRVRVEVLIINNKGKIFAMPNPGNKYGTDVTIPGGSVEPHRSFEYQVKAETLEEAGCNITDIKYSGQSYTISFNGHYPEWHKALWAKGHRYEGTVTYIFTAKYVNHPGYKEAEPWDLKTQKKFKFMDIDECNLRQEHIKALAMNKIKSKMADVRLK